MRQIETYKEETFALTGGVWNTEDANFGYNKTYTLALTARAANGYAFAQDLTVRLGNEAVPYTVRTAGSEIEIEFTYRFGYSVTVQIGQDVERIRDKLAGYSAVRCFRYPLL